MTPAEIIFALAVILSGVLLILLFAWHGVKTQTWLADMATKQAELQGRLSQIAEAAGAREEKLHQSLGNRLDQVSHRVGQSLSETAERNTKNLRELHERLALIDRAQKNIETLSGEVSGLQALLSNKQARGAFGEKQMQDLIENYLPPSVYTFQATLSNGKRVDALVHLPGEQGDVAIDSKFPMESWRRLSDAKDRDLLQAQQAFRADVRTHIRAVADKYLIFGETYDIALLFLPSEAIYAELHTNFSDLVEAGFAQKVMIVSPTTFMATLHTMRAVMKDAAVREQAYIIQGEIGRIATDVGRLAERTRKLQSHFRQADKDISDILISSDKISKRANRIENLEIPETEAPDPVRTPSQPEKAIAT